MYSNQKNISIINKQCHLEGTFDFKGLLIVAGSTTGTLHAETVITEESSTLNAVINAKYLTIAGFFKGEITTTGTLTLLKTANVEGCIRCGKLVIEEGCMFNGKISALPSAQP